MTARVLGLGIERVRRIEHERARITRCETVCANDDVVVARKLTIDPIEALDVGRSLLVGAIDPLGRFARVELLRLSQTSCTNLG